MHYKISYILWDITHRCSLKCRHCRASAPFAFEELSTEDGKSLLDQLEELGVKTLAISGGDPLLRNDLPELIKYATDKGMRVRIQTNGQLITDELLDKFKKAGCDEFGIGLDSCKPKNHDWLRNKPGAFEKTITSIKKIKRFGFRLHVEFTLNPQNKKELSEMIKFCDSLNVNTLFSRCVIPVGRGKDTKLLLSQKEYSNLLDTLCKEKYVNERLKIASEDPLWILTDKKLLKKVLSSHPNALEGGFISGCLAGLNMFYINPAGKVYPCSFINTELGDLKKEKFKDIIRKSDEKIPFMNRNNLKGKCKTCDLKYLCGGCRARAFFKFGDYFQEDPMCWKK